MALFRITPQGPPEAYKTYAAVAPAETHWRPAGCGEVDCPHHLHGWRSVIDEATELGQAQAHYVRRQSGRRFDEHHEGGVTVFVFVAGQECFTAHRVPLERDPVFLVREGDWRGNPRGTRPRVHARGSEWVEDFASHQQQLADRIERG